MDDFGNRIRAAKRESRPLNLATQAPVAPTPPTVSGPALPNRRRFRLPKLRRRMVVSIFIALVLIAALATAGLFYQRYQAAQAKADQLAKASSSQAPNQIQQLVSRIGKLTALPAGETPTLATITDVNKLSGQPFFTRAQNGDDVLIYNAAKMAYLFRPSTNQLINIAPIASTGTSQPAAGTSPSTPGKPLVTPSGTTSSSRQ